jgi:hypothetical protein
MTIRRQLRDSETRIAEDMTGVLDFLSRIQQGIEQGNWRYVQDKIPDLVRNAERLSTATEGAREEKHAARKPRPNFVIAAISEFARHYRAGRALYPTLLDHDAPTRRRLLERAARDIVENPPQGVNLADLDRLAGILRSYATGELP